MLDEHFLLTENQYTHEAEAGCEIEAAPSLRYLFIIKCLFHLMKGSSHGKKNDLIQKGFVQMSTKLQRGIHAKIKKPFIEHECVCSS